MIGKNTIAGRVDGTLIVGGGVIQGRFARIEGSWDPHLVMKPPDIGNRRV